MKEALFLFVYAIAKACMPLPSLEVVLLPLNIHRPDLWIWYSLLGAMGTFIGGSIGYVLACFIKENVWIHLFGQRMWDRGCTLVHRYGVLAIFIGGVTPVPDFLLAYLAGVTRMNYIAFALSDGLARLLRSLLVLSLFNRMGVLINMDEYGMLILYIIVFYMITKYLLKVIKSKE